MENLFAITPDPQKEVADLLLKNPHVRVERIVSTGQASPPGFWYDQEETEWVALLAGRAALELEDKTVLLEAGDTYLLPAHCRHRVASTSAEPPCVWLCIFTPQEG